MVIHTVVLPIGLGDSDRTQALTEAALDIAQPGETNIALVHLFGEDELNRSRERLVGYESTDDPISPDDVARRLNVVRELIERFEDADIDYSITGRVGDDDEVGEMIVSYAEDVDADRVIVGGRGRSPAGKAVFGSTAQAVLLNAPCPVTFVRDA